MTDNHICNKFDNLMNCRMSYSLYCKMECEHRKDLLFRENKGKTNKEIVEIRRKLKEMNKNGK